MRSKALVALYNISSNYFSSYSVWHCGYHTILYFRICIKHLLYLGRIDILSGGDYHIILSANDGYKAILVPGAKVVCVDIILVELLLCLLRVIAIAVRRLGWGLHNNLAYLLAVPCSQILRFCTPILINLNHTHIVIHTGTASCTGILRQVARAQEGIPEGLCCTITIIDIWSKHILIPYAGSPL